MYPHEILAVEAPGGKVGRLVPTALAEGKPRKSYFPGELAWFDRKGNTAEPPKACEPLRVWVQRVRVSDWSPNPE